jgi:hypothetical protein
MVRQGEEKVSARLADRAGPALGAVRTLLGAAMLARPLLIPRLFGADRVTAERVAWLVRMLGIREIALGGGALLHDTPAWVLAGAACDLTDGLVLAASARRGYVNPMIGAAAAGSSFAASAAGVAAVAGMRREAVR